MVRGVPNATIQRDLKKTPVKDEIKNFRKKHKFRLGMPIHQTSIDSLKHEG